MTPDNPMIEEAAADMLKPGLTEYWSKTNNLRFRFTGFAVQLEQMWQGSNGGERWEVVPTVNEDGKPA